MNWDDLGFLLSKNRYNENSLITEFFTEKHGKISGIIFGGTSKRIKNYLQIGNQLFVNYNSKSDGRSGYFKIEIYKAHSPKYFDEINKLNCISSAMSLIKLLTAESQANYKIYELIKYLYLILPNEDWLRKYIDWELDLLSNLGYSLDFQSIVKKETINGKIFYFTNSATEKKIVPNFLVEKKNTTNDINSLLDGLKILGDFMDKTILKPNNINLPISRNIFLNSLK